MIENGNELFHKALALQNANKYNESLELYKQLINSSGPFQEISLCNVGIIMVSLNQYNEALTLFDKSLSINSKNCVTLINKGLLLYNISEYKESLACYNQCLLVEPNNVYALFNKAILLYKIKRFKEALFNYKKVLEFNKNEINENDLFINFGDVFIKMGKYNNAVNYYMKTLDKDSKNFYALTNVGLAYKNLGFYKKALSYYKQAIKINNSNADLHWNMSIVLLSLGSLKKGFKEFEYRTNASSAQLDEIYKTYPFPLYNNESLENKTILIHPEQGYGDNIHMIRYLKLFSKLNVKVYVLALKEQKRLFSTITDIKIVTMQDTSWFKKIDYYIRILSLPHFFKTNIKTIPNKIPYFKIKNKNKNKNKKINISKNRINIGFVWQGEKNHENDKNRSVKLKYFEQLIKTFPRVSFYSLQLGEKFEKLNKYENVKDCSFLLKDFYDTATIVKKFDLVITIDSAVAHLSGALGVKTWVILPQIADWRWMIKTDKSPWYPTIKLFRQKKNKGWNQVFKNITSELKLFQSQYD